MTTPNEQPVSRRAARRAQQAAQPGDEHRDGGPRADSASGQDDAGASVPGSVPGTESIDYRTAVRPRVPRYAPEAAAPLDPAPTVPASSPLAPPFAPRIAPASGGGTRSRDFRPPSERGGWSSTFSPPPSDAALDYHTQASSPVSNTEPPASTSWPTFSAPAFSAQATSAPAVSAPAGSAHADLVPSADPDPDGRAGGLELAAPEYTMTRRELRALREAHAAEPVHESPVEALIEPEPAAGTVDVETDAAATEPPTDADGVDNRGTPTSTGLGIDAFDALLSGARTEAPMIEWGPDERSSVRSASASSAPSAPAADAIPAAEWRPSSVEAAEPAPLIEPGEPATGGIAVPAPSASAGSHWSAGFNEPADDPFENTFSRQVGSASVSTNALVLPEMPVGSLAGPVPGTGEIIITGMVEVPSSIASTGAVPSVHDSPDLDDLIDADDRELVSTDSAPVSAINAVSGHTATRSVISGRRTRGNLLTTVLIISTVVMAVAAVTIFIVAAANGLF